MNGFEKRLARSNARYAAPPRIDRMRAAWRIDARELSPLPPGLLGTAAGGARAVSGSARRRIEALGLRTPADPRAAGPGPHRTPAHTAESAGLRDRPAGSRRRIVSLWVRLLTAHDLIIRNVRRDFDTGLTLPQFDVLAQLQDAADGLTLAQLARRLLVTAGNLTGIVGRLERDGLVVRHEDPSDGRAFRIRLTGRGRESVKRLIPRRADRLERAFAALNSREQEDLRNLLGRLGEAMGHLTAAGGRETRSGRGGARS